MQMIDHDIHDYDLGGIGTTHRQCPRCETTYEITQDYDDPCPNQCQPVRNGSDLVYFRFHAHGHLYAWHPETKEALHINDIGLAVTPISEARLEDILKTAKRIPYSDVPNSLRLAVSTIWKVATKKRSVRAI